MVHFATNEFGGRRVTTRLSPCGLRYAEYRCFPPASMCSTTTCTVTVAVAVAVAVAIAACGFQMRPGDRRHGLQYRSCDAH